MKKRININSNISLVSVMFFLFFGLLNFNCANLNFGNQGLNKERVMLTTDYVPNEETAKKIAEAIWLPIYGEKIYNQKPYLATLSDNGVWVVKGTLTEGKRGGVAYIEIQKSDCKILKVTHGR